MKTTKTGRDLDRHAFNLGVGDPAGLIGAGLIAKSNAAASALETLLKRKEKDKSFRDFVHQQLLNAINEELDWLDEQIEIEQRVISQNNSDIVFIQTLDETNVLGPDGELRVDVQALLAKHGYDDLEGLEIAEIMLILHTVETDLHNENMERAERVEGYQNRHRALRDHASDIQQRAGSEMTPEMLQQFKDTIKREPFSATIEAMRDTENDAMTEGLQTVEMTKRASAISNSFKPF